MRVRNGEGGQVIVTIESPADLATWLTYSGAKLPEVAELPEMAEALKELQAKMDELERQ